MTHKEDPKVQSVADSFFYFQPEKESDEVANHKPLLHQNMNGGVKIHESISSHLAIKVSPPSQNKRITPSSATQLITDTASIDSGSVFNSPTSLKSYRSFASKTSVPTVKLDLINYMSNTSNILLIDDEGGETVDEINKDFEINVQSLPEAVEYVNSGVDNAVADTCACDNTNDTCDGD